MKRLLVLVALGTCACERNSQENSVSPLPKASDYGLAAPAPSSRPPPIVPMPETQAEVDRMILAGYTPHGDHLHAPGVNECPLTKGTEAVM